ncbi:MAG TPA: pantoate kinase [Candidatus Nanoarchaeia archaeon]|nr:pantoate kinase [Candidatus Nanoarchaeia archaeon]
MNSAKAFAPANISCIFKIYDHKNPRWMGSYGVGFTLNQGVIVEAAKSKRNEIIFNKKSINFPAVKSVIKKLTNKNLKINIKSKLPLGCGFGLSGASALASAYAINKLLNLKKTNKRLAIIAHIAEVKNKTGLGDVVNQFYGGFCVKLKPSSSFEIVKVPLSNIDVFCRYYSKISTKSILTNTKIRNKINDTATVSLGKIKNLIEDSQNIIFKELINISKEFSINSGLLKDKKTMEAIKSIEKNNGNASMIMLGNSVFSDKSFKGALKFRISDEGAHLI